MHSTRCAALWMLALLVAGARMLGEPLLNGAEQRDQFLERLRRAGYHDMVVAYLERLQKRAADDPAEQAEYRFLIGRALLDWAADELDLSKRAELLQRAEQTLRQYLDQPGRGTYVADASLELARLLFERGKLAAARARRGGDPDQATEALGEARKLLNQARQAFLDAARGFQQQMRQYPAYIDPRRSVTVQGKRLSGREAIRLRRQAEINWVLAQFQAALADYEVAQSYPEGSAEWRDQLEKAREQFEHIYQRHRTLLVGLHARLWMARCFEELGELRKAVGLYDELLRHDPAEQQDPAARAALIDLQRRVRLQWISAQNKLENYSLAYDAAREWLRRNRSLRDQHLRARALWEMATAARELARQLPEGNRDRQRLLREAINAWAELARNESDYRTLAVTELQRWAGSREAARAGVPMTFAAAVSLAEEALERKQWSEAVKLFRTALRLSDQADTPYQVTNARLRYAYALYEAGQLLDAAVLAEHVAAHGSDQTLARSAANIAMAAYWKTYRTMLSAASPAVRSAAPSLRRHAERMARLLVERWPESEQADFAHSLLGSTAWAEKRWEEAAAHYSRVSTRSETFRSAQLRAAEAWWQVYLQRRRSDDPDGAAAALAGAEQSATRVRQSLKAYQDQPPEDRPVDLARADLILARVRLEQGKLSEAQQLIEPYFAVLFTRDDLAPVRQPLLTTLLRLHLMQGDVDAAQRVLALLDELGAGDLKGLLMALAVQLADQARSGQAAQAGQALAALAERVAEAADVEDRDALRWLVPPLERVGEFDAAESVCRKLLELAGRDARARREAQLLLASVLRHKGDYAAAAELLVSSDRRRGVLVENPRAIDAILEYGRILSWWATEEPARWDQAIAHWNRYARLLGMARRRPAEYYEAWAYLLLSHIGKYRAKPADRRTAARGRALVEYALRSMPRSGLDAPLDPSRWPDLFRFAERVKLLLDAGQPYRALLEQARQALSSTATR